VPDFENFHTRLKVETAYPDGTRDHRDNFVQEEYQKNSQRQDQVSEPTGFVPMKGVTQAPKTKPKTKRVSRKNIKKDQSVMDANTQDLKSRNIK